MQLDELFEFLPSTWSHHQSLAADAKATAVVTKKELSFWGTQQLNQRHSGSWLQMILEPQEARSFRIP